MKQAKVRLNKIKHYNKLLDKRIIRIRKKMFRLIDNDKDMLNISCHYVHG